jgi:hypothetical protein
MRNGKETVQRGKGADTWQDEEARNTKPTSRRERNGTRVEEGPKVEMGGQKTRGKKRRGNYNNDDNNDNNTIR